MFDLENGRERTITAGQTIACTVSTVRRLHGAGADRYGQDAGRLHADQARAGAATPLSGEGDSISA